MKTKLTQRRFRAPKRSACAMCKPQQRGWADKKTPRDLRCAVSQEQELQEEETEPPPFSASRLVEQHPAEDGGYMDSVER